MWEDNFGDMDYAGCRDRQNNSNNRYFPHTIYFYCKVLLISVVIISDGHLVQLVIFVETQLSFHSS